MFVMLKTSYYLSNWQFCRVTINTYVEYLSSQDLRLSTRKFARFRIFYQPYTHLATSPYNFADHQITFLRTVDREALEGELHT